MLPDRLRRRLASPLPGLDAQLRMAPRPRFMQAAGLDMSALRPAAALLLIYPHDDEWHVVLTVRGSSLRHHTGQVSLPGGRLDGGESVEDAALREAFEEVGVLPSDVDVLGRLTSLPVFVSGHLLHPVVAYARTRPSFNLAAHEVDRIIEAPIAWFTQPERVRWEDRQRTMPPYEVMHVPYFALEDERVWGATAMVLSEFATLLQELADDE